MNIPRIVPKGTSKISLHERFTQLSKSQVTHLDDDTEVSVTGLSPRGGGVGRYGRGSSAARPTRLPYSPRMTEREQQYGPSPAMTAAAKIKKRSIRQRLGVKARLSLPTRNWGSEESLYSRDYDDNRRWGGLRRKTGVYLSRGGFGRAGWARYRNRNRWTPGWRRGGRWRGGRGRGRGQGSGRGQGRGRGRGREELQPSREQLDRELDTYMAGTKNILDKQLDDYMMEVKSAD